MLQTLPTTVATMFAMRHRDATFTGLLVLLVLCQLVQPLQGGTTVGVSSSSTTTTATTTSTTITTSTPAASSSSTTSQSTSPTTHPYISDRPGRTPPPYDDDYLKDVTPRKGFFDQFRAGFGFPTLYASHKTSETADVRVVGWIYAAVILAFSLLLVVPGVKRWNRRIYAVVRILIGVSFAVFIMICNFGQDWESGRVENVKTQYKAGVREEIKATISVNIGLRSVNISLKGEPRVQTFGHNLQNETIDYNERFRWDNRGWLVARPGFGPYAGRYNREFRAGQRYGLPYPILWIAEYLTIDGEGLRWGRHYLQAGYFTHIMLWSAFALWLLSLILYNMVPRYGGYFTLMTGAALLIGNVIYGNLRNGLDLRLPMVFDGCSKNVSRQLDDGSTVYVDDSTGCFMDLHYAWCFWLCLVTGIMCIVIGVVVVVMDILCPERLIEFLNGDISNDLEEFVEEDDGPTDEVANSRAANARHRRLQTVLSTRPSQASSSSSGGSSVRGGAAAAIEMRQQSNGTTASVDSADMNFQAFRKRTVLPRAQKLHKTERRSTADRPESIYPPPPAAAHHAAGAEGGGDPDDGFALYENSDQLRNGNQA